VYLFGKLHLRGYEDLLAVDGLVGEGQAAGCVEVEVAVDVLATHILITIKVASIA